MNAPSRPAAMVYRASGGPDYPDEWYLYPPVWDEECYPEIGVDLSGWAADLDRLPIDGPFDTEAEAEAALAALVRVRTARPCPIALAARSGV